MQIDKLIEGTIENLKGVVDSNNIVGKPIVNGDLVVVPISKITFGFVVGGGKYGSVYDGEHELPHANASGAGVNMQPIGFLVSDKNHVKFVSVDESQGDSKWSDLISASLKLIKDKK